MTIYVNDKPVKLPSDYMTVAEYLEWSGNGRGGAAVAINDNLVRRSDWVSRSLKENDRLTLITAAFGG